MEYLAIKRNEVLMYTTIWMNPKNIMLSERTQLKDHRKKWLPRTEGIRGKNEE